MTLNILDSIKEDVIILELSGQLDSSTASILKIKINQILQETKLKKIIINMKNLDFISSAGWSVFVETAKEIRKINGDLRLAEMKKDAERIFTLLGMDSYLKSYKTTELALNSFNE